MHLADESILELLPPPHCYYRYHLRRCCSCLEGHAFAPARQRLTSVVQRVSLNVCPCQMAYWLSVAPKEGQFACSPVAVSQTAHYIEGLQRTVSFILFHFFFNISMIRASSKRPASLPQSLPFSIFLSSLFSVQSFLSLAKPWNFDPSA